MVCFSSAKIASKFTARSRGIGFCLVLLHRILLICDYDVHPCGVHRTGYVGQDTRHNKLLRHGLDTSDSENKPSVHLHRMVYDLSSYR